MNNPPTNKRGPRSVPNKLQMAYGNHPDVGPDIIFNWGKGCSSSDGALLNYYMCSERPPAIPGEPWMKSLVDELVERGYDITTLKFSIEKKKR